MAKWCPATPCRCINAWTSAPRSPPCEEMQGIPHHMIDVAEPWEDFSVAATVIWPPPLWTISFPGKNRRDCGRNRALHGFSHPRQRLCPPFPATGVRERLEAQADTVGMEAMLFAASLRRAPTPPGVCIFPTGSASSGRWRFIWKPARPLRNTTGRRRPFRPVLPYLAGAGLCPAGRAVPPYRSAGQSHASAGAGGGNSGASRRRHSRKRPPPCRPSATRNSWTPLTAGVQ